MVPQHLHYTREHEWVLITENSRVLFGITDHAQESLGDVVYVTLPSVGSEITAGHPCGEIESTKSVADLFAPVSGRVTGTNDRVLTAPDVLNSDPYGTGWLVEVEPVGTYPLAGLLSPAEYERILAGGSAT